MKYLKPFLVFALLIMTLGVSEIMKPELRVKIAESAPDFEVIVPKTISGWSQRGGGLQLVDPDMQGSLDKIYNQTLSRTYVNKDGQSIMLSIAYGVDQRDSMSVHKPEVCYPAQGFVVHKQWKDELDTGYGVIPAKFLETSMQMRREFVIYWILLGDEVVATGMKRKLKQLEYGLSGVIPDGLLFRTSSIGNNEEDEFELQKAFITQLLGAINRSDRQLLIGKF